MAKYRTHSIEFKRQVVKELPAESRPTRSPSTTASAAI
jgi:hypothetical protein